MDSVFIDPPTNKLLSIGLAQLLARCELSGLHCNHISVVISLRLSHANTNFVYARFYENVCQIALFRLKLTNINGLSAVTIGLISSVIKVLSNTYLKLQWNQNDLDLFHLH